MLRLRTTARLLHTTAHPDDEDGAMLTYEARGRGAAVTLLTLNRGEGGQNKMGSSLLDALGALRTLELLAADRYYGVQQRFTRAVDFGYSKTADETFAKWQGHDPVLADMVRVIRTFRPDVIVSRFQGTAKDGHGQHQAAGILTREAFHAAADPNRFADQIKAGLLPWQAKKLYVDNVRPPDEHTLAMNVGKGDPTLGMSYAQFAMQGLRHQLSQGAGEWNPSQAPRYYRLVESAIANVAAGTAEQDFFDSLDTTLPGLAERPGFASLVPWLRPELVRIETKVNQASAAAARSPQAAAGPLLAGLAATKSLMTRVEAATLPAGDKEEVLTKLATKVEQFERAVNLALAVRLSAVVEAPATLPGGFMAYPGESFVVTTTLEKPAAVDTPRMRLEVPRGWATQRLSSLATKGRLTVRFRVTVAPDAPYTRPCVYREDDSKALYDVHDDRCAVLPQPAAGARAVANYAYVGQSGIVAAPVEVEFRQATNILARRDLAVGPKFSVGADPMRCVIRTVDGAPIAIAVTARSNVAKRATADIALMAPPAWNSSTTPGATNCNALLSQAEQHECSYRLTPPAALPEGRYSAQAEVTHAGVKYTEGATLITRSDLGSAIYYQPAIVRISAVDVKLPPGLKVGYVMGAGDEIPTVLQQLGMDITLLSEQDLAGGDLSRFGTIIVGIRAYDTRDDLRRHNQRLLDYVTAGGTLVVQYNAGVAQFNSGHFTPFAAEVGRERVSVEEAPVEILRPQDPLFHFPNLIGARDFEGWVQERGLYFMHNWDGHFDPLLSSHDPGEPALQGGLLRARVGKGTYIYTGYSFFRELPAGVPGAVRLFINLISAGHQ